MSVTLATMADALIEFILSLLRDPDAAAEFDADPGGAMAARGLNNVRYDDVCAVAPVVVDRPAVVPRPSEVSPSVTPPSVDPVVNEIRNITNNFSWIDDRDTIVDQSVNQNIWAGGDVTQTFDQEAVVASGDDAIAAGDDVGIETNIDDSTNFNADGGDVNVGNDTTNNTTTGSYNQATDASTNTDASTTTVAVLSGNDASTNTSAAESYNETAASNTETSVDTDSNVIYDSSDSGIIDTTTDDQF